MSQHVQVHISADIAAKLSTISYTEDHNIFKVYNLKETRCSAVKVSVNFMCDVRPDTLHGAPLEQAKLQSQCDGEFEFDSHLP